MTKATPVGDTATANGKHVLLAEDDDTVRTVLVGLLEWGGFAVSEARTGAEALTIARANPEGFDVVVTDIRMPGMSGLDLGRAVREIRPLVPLVLITGNLDQVEDVPLGALLLGKPFGSDEFVDRVNEALAAQHAT